VVQVRDLGIEQKRGARRDPATLVSIHRDAVRRPTDDFSFRPASQERKT